ncbi:DNA adenine methylase [Halosimplex pelagicum]|uniref:site-specific DNA-methyltransferase (adenine-specific) n=1 Tax=Halosimplex pelagicum TaxID=869886 RepID=A0A7D5PCN8_9EURY|nr:DNA adenine methylase [Halosimplex pelagicum]QLH83362.1 DNA adenine methylase [Halosimplex pelagicum]
MASDGSAHGTDHSGPLCAFPYYGGKTAYAKQIAERMPAHRRYVEAFGGGGSVLLNKPRSDIEVFNDADENLVRFFRVLRHREDELRGWLESCPYARAEHEKWATQFYGAGEVPDDLDDVTRAGRWFVLRHTQYGAITKSRSGFSTPYERNEARSLRQNVDRLDLVRERFADVVVECDDYAALADRYDGPDTFWYFDPPYVGNEHEYLGEFSHAEFVETVAELEGDWMISYRELPDGLRDLAETVDEFGATDRADGVKKETERLVMSYDPGQVRAFAEAEQRTLFAATDGGKERSIEPGTQQPEGSQ